MVAGLLAVLKAGGVYVPLDPAYPRERLSFILEDAGVTVLVADRPSLASLPDHGARLLLLGGPTDEASAHTAADSRATGDDPAAADDSHAADGTANSAGGRAGADDAADLAEAADPANLAYVIYTSGSTGRPKGVAVTRGSLSHLLLAAGERFGLRGEDRLPALASFAFDISLFELLGPLAGGGSVEVCAREQVLEPRLLAGVVRRATLLHAVPSLLRQVVSQARAGASADAEAALTTGDAGASVADSAGEGRLRQVFVGGEAVPGDLLDESRRAWAGAAVEVLYGPTEATLFCTTHAARAWGERGRPIGRALGEARCYVVEAGGAELAPLGVAGELYVGGEGVARGYLNRPALTAERFVPDPYSGEAGARLYRTGDVARWRAEGELEFVGRLDGQVKVRGHRIELGEVEAALLAEACVREAAVVVRCEGVGAEDSGGGPRLVGYIVAEQGGEGPTASRLRERLRERLPEYMVPSAFVLLEALPLTPNGKVDRKALPEPDAAGEGAGYEAPRAGLEELVAGVFASVLKAERVGRADNFFELGGHSLLATQAISRLREACGVEVPLRALFEHPTVEGQARVVEAALRGGDSSTAPPPLVRVSREQELPLSFAQQRLWFLDQLEPASSFYNIPSAVRLRGALDVRALSRALSEVVHRHEALRTTFPSVEGRPVQLINPPRPLVVEVEDLGQVAEAGREAEALRLAGVEASLPFDLADGPLVRARLLRLSEQDYVLLLTMHHIVSDGWSSGILVGELTTLYGAFLRGEPSPLPELEVQYADYAVWQRGWLSGEVLEAELSYWRTQLGGELPVLELPTDRPRPAAQSYRGASEPLRLSGELTEGLRELSRRQGCTLFMTLLAAFDALLSRYSRQEDIVVGSPVAGRNRVETERLIGFFVNTLVLRTDLSGEPSFVELMRRVREVSLGAYAHQEVPFEKLVEELQPERDPSRSPLFQVMLALQNARGASAKGAEGGKDWGRALGLTTLESEAGTTKFDLTLSLVEGARSVQGVLEYSTDLFDAGAMRRAVGHLENLLSAAARNPELPITELPLMSEGERREVLSARNDTARTLPHAHSPLHLPFELRAAEAPNLPALIFHERRLTYAELNARANQLARHLRALGVGPEVLVGVCMERGVEMIVSVLAVLKAGGAYLPLDPAYPAERLAFMLADSGARVLVTERRHLASLPGQETSVVLLDEQQEGLSSYPAEDLRAEVDAASLAYVIYTSGSTGRPKAVGVSHANASHSTAARLAYYKEPVGGFLLVPSFAFDSSVAVIFWA
ncbi:MAG TPA: amino acid adenylation domain-containing protein, partial [Pyrinomonadaceae bacterium]|nr:amino acid adenylation domain-containing protein [Pyrinomonadaceae bacterium]